MTSRVHRRELERVGVAIEDFLSYEPTGGECRRRPCGNDAPKVMLDGRVIALPCRIHQEEEEAAYEAEQCEIRATRFMLDSGATRRMQAFSFDTYRAVCDDRNGQKALAMAEQWVADYKAGRPAPNILMHGPRGTGKTGLAWSMVRSLCEDGFEARIVNFAHLLEEMKDCYARRLSTTFAADAHRLPVLVLDDLGVEKPTEWACGQLYGIVDHRYENGLPTIFVSNYGPDALAARLGRDDAVVGGRIVSRMAEGAIKFEFRGEDRRVAA